MNSSLGRSILLKMLKTSGRLKGGGGEGVRPPPIGSEFFFQKAAFFGVKGI